LVGIGRITDHEVDRRALTTATTNPSGASRIGPFSRFGFAPAIGARG
jgi:hypothetical protein